MIEVLVRAKASDNVLKGAYSIGFPVVACPAGWNWGGEECPPNFVIIKITDTNDTTGIIEPWMRKTFYEILSHEPTSDSFRVRIYPELDKHGSTVNKALMASFLKNWGATQIVDGAPGVVFEISAFAAINNSGLFTFGDKDDLITCVETSYDVVTGTHTVSMDYTIADLDAETVAKVLFEAGLTVVSNELGICVFTGERAAMIKQLERQVEHRFHTMVARARWRLPDYVVESAMSGSVEMTLQQYDDLLLDVSDEV